MTTTSITIFNNSDNAATASFICFGVKQEQGAFREPGRIAKSGEPASRAASTRAAGVPHTPGSISLYLPRENEVIAGNMLFRGSVVVFLRA